MPDVPDRVGPMRVTNTESTLFQGTNGHRYLNISVIAQNTDAGQTVNLKLGIAGTADTQLLLQGDIRPKEEVAWDTRFVLKDTEAFRMIASVTNLITITFSYVDHPLS